MSVARLADLGSGGFKLSSLLERERELAVLERCLAATCGGRGMAVVVEGPAGIGKTTLLRAGRILAGARGVSALSARGTPLEQDFSYGVVRQLYERFSLAGGAEYGELATGAATLALRAFTDVEPTLRLSPEDASFSTLHGLYWLTANLASRAPLLLLVDDCHCADAASLRFLAHLASMDGLPALVLATVRAGDRATVPELLDEFRVLAGETVRPLPLGPAAAARVVRTRLGTATDGFCRSCHRATGGNPLLLQSLVAGFAADGGDPGDAAAARVQEYGAESVARLLVRRLALLPAGADAFVRALAVLGDGSPLRHVATLAESSGTPRSWQTGCDRPRFLRARLTWGSLIRSSGRRRRRRSAARSGHSRTRARRRCLPQRRRRRTGLPCTCCTLILAATRRWSRPYARQPRSQ